MAKHVLLSLAETVCARMRQDKVYGTVVSVGIKNHLFEHATHQMKLPTPTNITMELYTYACRLFDQLWDGTPIRQLAVRSTGITKERFSQLDLFRPERYEKYSRMEQTVDSIRTKYGNDAIIRASFLSSPIYHMSGGIQAEKSELIKFERREEGCKRLFRST